MGRLHEAIIENDYDLVEELIEEGEDVNEANSDGILPIDLSDDSRMLDILFAYGAIRELDYYSFNSRYYADFEYVYSFDVDLKLEIYSKLREKYHYSQDMITNEDIQNANDGILYDFRTIGIKKIDREIVEFEDNYISVMEINDLLELMGYDVKYEGSNNRVEGQTGIYFVE